MPDNVLFLGLFFLFLLLLSLFLALSSFDLLVALRARLRSMLPGELVSLELKTHKIVLVNTLLIILLSLCSWLPTLTFLKKNLTVPVIIFYSTPVLKSTILINSQYDDLLFLTIVTFHCAMYNWKQIKTMKRVWFPTVFSQIFQELDLWRRIIQECLNKIFVLKVEH